MLKKKHIYFCMENISVRSIYVVSNYAHLYMYIVLTDPPLPTTFELTNLKYDKVMIQVNIFSYKKFLFKFLLWCLCPVCCFLTQGGDVPVPSSMLFPDSGFEILRGHPPFLIQWHVCPMRNRPVGIQPFLVKQEKTKSMAGDIPK